MKREKTITVLVKNPGEAAQLSRVENTGEALRELVDGWLESVTIATDVVILCNEEGRLYGLPENCTILGIDFVGPIVVCGRRGEHFASLKDGAIQMVREMLEGDSCESC